MNVRARFVSAAVLAATLLATPLLSACGPSEVTTTRRTTSSTTTVACPAGTVLQSDGTCR